jgi:hypothetical protein
VRSQRLLKEVVGKVEEKAVPKRETPAGKL